jgi:hypothetical protein
MDVQSHILIGWLDRILISLSEKKMMELQTLRNERCTHFSNQFVDVTVREEATGKISIFAAIFHVHSIYNQKPGQENERQNLLQ